MKLSSSSMSTLTILNFVCGSWLSSKGTRVEAIEASSCARPPSSPSTPEPRTRTPLFSNRVSSVRGRSRVQAPKSQARSSPSSRDSPSTSRSKSTASTFLARSCRTSLRQSSASGSSSDRLRSTPSGKAMRFSNRRSCSSSTPASAPSESLYADTALSLPQLHAAQDSVSTNQDVHPRRGGSACLPIVPYMKWVRRLRTRGANRAERGSSSDCQDIMILVICGKTGGRSTGHGR